MIHKMLMASSNTAEPIDYSYQIQNIAYSGTATPNIQSIEPKRFLTQDRHIFYNFGFFNNGQGILYSNGTNSDFFVGQNFFGGGAYTKGTELFDSTKVGNATNIFDRVDYITFIDANNLVGGYGNTLKKFSCTTPWDVSTIGAQTFETIAHASPPFAGSIRYLKFTPTGDHIIIATNSAYNGSFDSIFKFALSTPYDIATIAASPVQSTLLGNQYMHINDAGTVITYQRNISDWIYRQRTMSTPFDLSTLSAETTYTYTLSDLHGDSGNSGMAFAEAHGSFAAGEVFFFLRGWSLTNNIHRGVCSTPYDLSTITWDTWMPSGVKAATLTDPSNNNVSTNLLFSQLYIENNSNIFRHGQYLEAYSSNLNGDLGKDIWSLGSLYQAAGTSTVGTASYINEDVWRRVGSPNLRSRSGYRIFLNNDDNLPLTWYLSYVRPTLGGGLGSTDTLDWSTRSEVDITTWIMDGLVGDNGNNLAYPFAMALRQQAEDDNTLNGQRRLWVALDTYADGVRVRQMTSNTSSVNSNPSFWSQDTGGTSTWIVPTGGTNEPPTDAKFKDMDVSYDGKYILFLTLDGNIYLFENDNPWDITGNITAIQSETLPLVGNSRPIYIKYNNDGTKLFVVDMSSIIFEYDVGT